MTDSDAGVVLPACARAVKVTDDWSGGREHLLGIFPGLEAGPDAHEHHHHDGGFYWHEHMGGHYAHHHDYICGNDAHGPGRVAQCTVPPEAASPGTTEGEDGRDD